MYDIDGNDRLYQLGFREYFNHHSLQADVYDIDGNDRLYQVGFREYFNHHSLQADVHDYDGNKQYICVCVCGTG